MSVSRVNIITIIIANIANIIVIINIGSILETHDLGQRIAKETATLRSCLTRTLLY